MSNHAGIQKLSRGIQRNIGHGKSRTYKRKRRQNKKNTKKKFRPPTSSTMWITSKRYLGEKHQMSCNKKIKPNEKNEENERKKLRIWVIIQVLADFLHTRHDRNLNETCVSISGSSSNLFIKLKPFSFFSRSVSFLP